ncbi:MAG TPA: helix-turn-helix transcriptional regulator [Acidimicrobiia bacterium]|nr:helix-turn-helix transcriptional regulator [Acidimicrobiia bacterium]
MKIQTMRDLATVLRGRRTDLGWSQERLAASADVSRSWLARFELGKGATEVSRLLAVFDSLGLTLDVSPSETTEKAIPRSSDTDTVDLDEHLRRYE